ARLSSYEWDRPVSSCAVIALSVAYELELSGVVDALALSGIAPLAAERDESAPFVLCGGALTNSHPLPLAPFADAILMGEAEESVHAALDVLAEAATKQEACAALARA